MKRTYTDKPELGRFYHLDGKPEFTGAERGDFPEVRLGDHLLKWSNSKFLPQIGDRVFITMNGFGPGRVVGYLIEAEFLGVEVEVDKRPAWHIKQHGNNHPRPMVFGAEIRPEVAA